MTSTLPGEATLGDNQRGIPVGNKAYGTSKKKQKTTKTRLVPKLEARQTSDA